MEAMNLQDDFSFSIDNSKVHFLLVLGLTSMQSNSENCQCPEIVGKSMRLQLCFTYTLEHVSELIVWVALDKFNVVEKYFLNG